MNPSERIEAVWRKLESKNQKELVTFVPLILGLFTGATECHGTLTGEDVAKLFEFAEEHNSRAFTVTLRIPPRPPIVSCNVDECTICAERERKSTAEKKQKGCP